MFGPVPNESRRQRVEAEVRRMGYEFHEIAATIRQTGSGALKVRVEPQNRGVAPFYYDWPAGFCLWPGDGSAIQIVRGHEKVPGLLPGEPSRVWNEQLDFDTPCGRCKLGRRVVNPFPNGKPLRFAHREQDADAPGWLTLGVIQQ